MAERIHKLQPDRMLALRGFDDRGAAAALHSATATSFAVSGVFRDSADFCVLILHDADDFYSPPRLKYLPDFNFAGVTLSFDVAYTGLIPLDSSLFPSIDWPYLDVIREDGTTAKVRLVPSGGSASAWHVSIDFSAAGIGSIRQAWLTFAPPIPPGAAYPGGEWAAVFSNWVVGGDNRWLRFASADSVRVEETDRWCRYEGSTWGVESGFYSKGFSRVGRSGDTVSISYHSGAVHELFLGTSLSVDRGVWGISIDGGAESELDTYLNGAAQVNARRTISSTMSAGSHTVTLRHKRGGPVYFDFLDAVAVSETTPDPEAVYTDLAPASDYGTDHGYKLSPARLAWLFHEMGWRGPWNFYVSVFWWNQRRVEGRVLPSVTLEIPAAAAVAGYNVFVKVGDSVSGYFVLGGDTTAIVAAGVAADVNADSVGVWASSSGPFVTITNRAATSIYDFTFEAWYETPARVEIGFTGSLRYAATPGVWVIDEAATPALNRGARDYLADLAAECARRGRELTLAYSMELLNPPADWAARYPDGTAVTTATGFATNFTTHCAFLSGILAYQQRVYLESAAIMVAAGLTPRLQFGEFVWWFFAEHGGMAYYDAGTRGAALAALGRDLRVFTGPDDFSAADAADVAFLAGRLVSHCAAIRGYVRGVYPDALFEILLPLDVNFPAVYSALSPLTGTTYELGGRLNHAVNVPAEFLSPASAPFDRIKIEGLDFGAGSRHGDRAVYAMEWPFVEGSWPRSSCRYLVAVFNGGCPWVWETRRARDAGLAVNFWAFDHFCLFGWDLREIQGSAESAQESPV